MVIVLVAVLAGALAAWLLLFSGSESKKTKRPPVPAIPTARQPLTAAEELNRQLDNGQGKPAQSVNAIYRRSKRQAVVISVICLPAGPGGGSGNYVPRISSIQRQGKNWIPAQQRTPQFFRSVGDPNLRQALPNKGQRRQAWKLAQSLTAKLPADCRPESGVASPGQ